MVFFLILSALLAPWVTPYPQDAKFGIHFKDKLKPPSSEHYFGTDAIGPGYIYPGRFRCPHVNQDRGDGDGYCPGFRGTPGADGLLFWRSYQ